MIFYVYYKMLVIHHTHYKNEATRLMRLREKKMSVYIATVSDGHRDVDVASIIQDHPKCKYVCLIGNEIEVKSVMFNTGSAWGSGDNDITAASDLWLTFGVTNGKLNPLPDAMGATKMIGRLTTGPNSASLFEKKQNIKKQLDKLVDYEDTYNAQVCPSWVNNIMGVASGEGTASGYQGMADSEFMRTQLQLLKTQGYTVKGYFDQLQRQTTDPDVADIQQGFEQGASLFCYVGHGTETTIPTSGFDVDDATTHDKQYPFCIFVACSVGSFDEDGICLAESLQIKKNGGSICACGSTKLQTWTPPMHALATMLKTIRTYISGNSPFRTTDLTCGDIFQSGLRHIYGNGQQTQSESVDRKDALAWTFFGDPSTPFNTPCRSRVILPKPKEPDTPEKTKEPDTPVKPKEPDTPEKPTVTLTTGLPVKSTEKGDDKISKQNKRFLCLSLLCFGVFGYTVYQSG